jgi:hypothetical protein
MNQLVEKVTVVIFSTIFSQPACDESSNWFSRLFTGDSPAQLHDPRRTLPAIAGRQLQIYEVRYFTYRQL